jgi:hypothetical protein
MGAASQDVRSEIEARARSARDHAARRKSKEQEGVVEAPAPEIGSYLATFRQSASGFFDEGFRLCTVDLSKVYAIQPTTFVDYLAEEISALSPGDAQRIAAVTLPIETQVEMSVAPDPAQKTITLSSPNLNLKLLGLQAQPGAGGGCVMSFQAGAVNSILQVARLNGRYFCRDGHTRAVQLLRHRIVRVPALLKEFSSYSEVAPNPNLFPEAVSLGTNPPTLADFLDDQVAADVWLPTTKRAVVVSATEVEIAV